MWLAGGVASNFFETRDSKRARKQLKDSVERADDAHRRLWPGIAVPQFQQKRFHEDSMEASLPTSLMFGFLVHMMSQPKRKTNFRLRAYELLKAFIDQLAVHQPQLEFLITDVPGNAHWETQTLSTPYSCTPWSSEFFQHYLQMTWLSDLQSRDVPWVTSYPVEGQLHLADWIAFSIDRPAWLLKKANQEILWAKQAAERSALSVLTQLAHLLEVNLLKITVPDDSGRKKKKLKPLNKVAKWNFVAQAMDMVFQRKETLMC